MTASEVDLEGQGQSGFGFTNEQHSSPDSLEKASTKGQNVEEKGTSVPQSASSDEATGNVGPKMTPRLFMSLTAMSFLWCGSQIPLYLFGGIPPEIYSDIGGTDRWIWFVLAHLLSIAAVCPFVGSISDLIGRRYVALIGTSFCVLGTIVCSTAKTMNTFICGMCLAGVGAAMNELTALAATSEMAPAAQRGTYVSFLMLTILPFMPCVLYGQLIAHHSSWRYVGIIPGVWNALGFIMTAAFYFPPPRPNALGLSRREILGRIDYGGGLLFISGTIVFLAGLQWGGYQYGWKSVHALVPLFIGFFTLVAFGLYEWKLAPYPIIPHHFEGDTRDLILTMVITFISGCNFFAFIMFWPTQSFNVYGDDPVQVGLRGLPISFGILGGSCIILILVSRFKGAIRELLLVSCVIMTVGVGGMAYANADNLHKIWGFLIVGSLGIGGIIVPASIISTIISPDHMIATITALNMSIRFIGGAIGFAIYYSVFQSKFVPKAIENVGGVMMEQLNITNQTVITEAIGLIAASQNQALHTLPGIGTNETAWAMVDRAAKVTFADSYVYVYYVSIAFGSLSIICACFLGNIRKHMDDHIAVVLR